MFFQTEASLRKKIDAASEKIGKNLLFFIKTKDSLVIGFRSAGPKQIILPIIGPIVIGITGTYDSCNRLFSDIGNKMVKILESFLGDWKYVSGVFVCKYVSALISSRLKEDLAGYSAELMVYDFFYLPPPKTLSTPWIIKANGERISAEGGCGIIGSRYDGSGNLKYAEFLEKPLKAAVQQEADAIKQEKAIEILKDFLNSLKKEDEAESENFKYEIKTFFLAKSKGELMIKSRDIDL